jgi:molybdopterin molybdotransferase
MISVDEARAKVLSGIRPVGNEQVSVANAVGRVLAEAVTARVSHPPADVSAMDGFAVRAKDAAGAPTRLVIIGESAAGRPFGQPLTTGKAVRIFTGAVIPEGADCVVMQEDVVVVGSGVRLPKKVPAGNFIRAAGQDFKAGDVLVEAGKVLTARDVALIAAANHPWVTVKRKPRVAILSTGDEVKAPGEPLGPADVVGCNGLALAAYVTAHGGEPIVLGTARDTLNSLNDCLAGARGADLLVTTGGASVGDHDLVGKAIGGEVALEFHKVAMRPGKPVMFGRIGEVPVIGLPGNPVSVLVSAEVYISPALRVMRGLSGELPTLPAVLGRNLPYNDERQDYMRASLSRDDQGRLVATPFEVQDSGVITGMARADCLVIRPPKAFAAKAGDAVTIIRLDEGL